MRPANRLRVIPFMHSAQEVGQGDDACAEFGTDAFEDFKRGADYVEGAHWRFETQIYTLPINILDSITCRQR